MCVCFARSHFLPIIKIAPTVLGIGTYLSFQCGTNCSNGDAEYTCDNGKAAYSEIFGKDKSLRIQLNKCGHWSGM